MLNKLCKVLFITLFLVTLQSYAAAPPPLPPALPSSELNTENTEVSTDSGSSIFDKFKQFFSKSSKKASSPQPQTKQNDQEESKLASQKVSENEASEPFMDVGSTSLPSAANESNAKLASNNNVTDTKSSEQANENEASEPFIDIGSTPLPSAANNDLPDNEVAHNSSTNLASNNAAEIQLPVTPNVPRTRITMPPLPSGSYVVPPTPAVQIYKPINLPHTHIPTPLNTPPNTNKQQNNVTSPATPNNTPIVAPTPAATSSTSSTPVVPISVDNSPATPNNAPTPAVAPNAIPTPAVAPPTSNMPPVSTPVINSPIVPNNIPVSPPATTPVPVVPNTPTAPTTTESSTEIDNSKQIFTASVNSSTKQNWNTSLKPVEVLAAGQNQSSNNNVSPPANQPQVQPKNTSSSSEIVKKQDNNINNEITESAAKFAKDESQVLLLPNDDIVLGKLTKTATLEQMDIYSYIKRFQKKEKWVANTDRRKAVESLVKYDSDINKKKDIYTNLSYCSAVDNAFKAIDRDNLSKLRTLLDVYPILQEKNRGGETLLTAATYKDNYYLAKYLVIRGIKISTLNSKCQYPLDIALARGNANIACMLIKAKGYN